MRLDGEGDIRTHSRLLLAAARLSDAELLGRVVHLAREEREATVELVAHLAELDARRLYLGEGFGSLFGYCIGALRLAEHAAYNRIEAARASRRFPSILDLLADGSLNLATVRLLTPHLQPETFDAVVAQAKGKSKREVEVLVASLAPRPDVAAWVRKLPAAVQLARAPLAAVEPTALPPTGASPPDAPGTPLHGAAQSAQATAPVGPAPASRPVVTPLAPGRYRVQFTIGEATHSRLRHAQQLLRREIPDGDPGAIFDRALALLLEDVVRKKLAATPRPRDVGHARSLPAKRDEVKQAPPIRKQSRHIPARVRRAVWRRDGGRCAFVASNGQRCTERAFLELHHREPYAVGGEATVANISLRCRAHNTYEAVKALGSAGTARGTLGIAPNGPRRQLAPGRVGPMLQGCDPPPAPRSRGMAATASGDVVAT
jgi:5-methylcytosine-specific restriction endonuclease McrA